MTQSPSLAAPVAWNAVADGYFEDLLPVFELYSKDALELAEVSAGDRVLDVAAGPGTLSLLAAPRVEHVTAVDFSEQMVRILRQRIAAKGLGNVEVLQEDAQKLPFAEAVFDAVFSMFGLMFFPDRAAGLREIHRVLRPGGRAVIASWSPIEKVPLLAGLFQAIREHLPELPFGSGKSPLSEPADVQRELEEAEFREVAVHVRSHLLPINSVRGFWVAQQRSSAPLALLRMKLDAEEWQDLSEAIAQRLERQFGAEPLEVSWEALVGVGSR